MGLADFLFTPTLQKVLGATLFHPDRSFTLRELLRLADSGRGSAQKQIERLINSGVLLEDERRGSQRSIRVNTEFIFYAELRSIARKSFSVVEPLKEALAPFASNISSAFVFGSIAKSTDSAKSDIDLIVIGQVSLPELSDALYEAETKLMRPVNFSLYEPEEWTNLVESDTVIAQIANGVTLKVV